MSMEKKINVAATKMLWWLGRVTRMGRKETTKLKEQSELLNRLRRFKNRGYTGMEMWWEEARTTYNREKGERDQGKVDEKKGIESVIESESKGIWGQCICK